MITTRSVQPRNCDHTRLPSLPQVNYRMGMPATHTDWTVDMVDALPDDGQRYELIDGELYLTPAPAEVHQLIVGELYVRLREYLKGLNIGRAMIAPADVRRGDRSRNRVQPDVFVTRLTEGKRPAYPYDLHDLLLAVEIASPSNPLLDYQIKRDLYLREGVAEYWIINPEARNVSRWRGRGDPGEILSETVDWRLVGASEPFVLELTEFFAEAFS